MNTILFLLHSNSFRGGGTVRSHLELVERLSRDDISVHTAMPFQARSQNDKVDNYPDMLISCGSYVHYVSDLVPWFREDTVSKQSIAPLSLSSLASRELELLLIRLSPDLCVTQTGVFPQLALACLNSSINHIWYIREYGDLDYNLNLRGSPLSTGLLYNALSDYVIYNSRSVQEHFEDRARFSYQSSVVPPWPASENLPIQAIPDASISRRPLRVAVLGALIKNKNQLCVLEALLRDKNLRNGSIEVYIYGEGPEASKILHYAKENSIERFVFLMGHVDDCDSIYKNTDLLVVPALREAFGRTPIEAARYGIPSICANTSGISDYISHGENGWIFDQGSVESLSAVLRALIADRDQLYQVGSRALNDLASPSKADEVYRSFYAICKKICSVKQSHSDPVIMLLRSMSMGVFTSSSQPRKYLDYSTLSGALSQKARHLFKMLLGIARPSIRKMFGHS